MNIFLRFVFLLFLLFNHSFFAIAQNSKIDFLRTKLLQAELPDSVEFKTLNDLSRTYYQINFDSASYYFQRATDFAWQAELSFLLPSAYQRFVLAQYLQGNYDSAFFYSEEGYRVAVKVNDIRYMGDFQRFMGSLTDDLGDYPGAIKYYQQAIEHFEEGNIQNGLSTSINGIGVAYENMGNFPKAIEQYQKSLKISEKNGDKKGVAQAYNNIGIIHKNRKEYSEALQYYRKALAINQEENSAFAMAINSANIGKVFNFRKQYDSAIFYYQEALRLDQSLNDETGISADYNDLGTVYKNLNDFEKALQYHRLSIGIREKNNERNKLPESYYELGEVYFLMKKYAQAIELGQKGYALALETGNLEFRTSNAALLAKTYEKTADFKKAYSFSNLYKSLSDSVFNQANTRKITQLEMQFDFDRKEQAIRVEQEKNELVFQQQIEEETRLRNLALAFGAGLFLLVGLLFRNIQIKRRHNRVLREKGQEILEQSQEIRAQRDQLLDQNHLINNQKEEISMQTEELIATNEKLEELAVFKEKMTAMIVHDLKNPLNSIIGLTESGFDPKAQKKINFAGKELLYMVTNLLDIQKFEEQAMKLDIEKIPLSEVVGDAVFSVELLAKEKEIKIKPAFEVSAILLVDRELIYRVLVNILVNAIKFSPRKGYVVISAKPDTAGSLKVLISDEGEGIPEASQDAIFQQYNQLKKQKSGNTISTGLGLTFCKMAIEAHNGSIGVDSVLHEGSTFWFTLPVFSIEQQEMRSEAIFEEKRKPPSSSSFSENEIQILKIVIEKISQFEIFEFSAIKKILDEKRAIMNAPPLVEWLESMDKALLATDEERFNSLIEVV